MLASLIGIWQPQSLEVTLSRGLLLSISNLDVKLILHNAMPTWQIRIMLQATRGVIAGCNRLITFVRLLGHIINHDFMFGYLPE